MVAVHSASAADAEVTGAPPGSDLDRFLKLQNLKVEDVEANRAGKVSPRQAATVGARRGNVTTWLLLGFGGFFALALAAAITDYMQKKHFKAMILPAIAGTVGIIAYVVYAMFWRPPSAEEVAKQKVVTIQGVADSISYWPHKGFYDIKMNGVKYQGYTTMDPGYEGHKVKLHVIPESKLVVAMEPAD